MAKLRKFLLRYYPPGIILEYEQNGEVCLPDDYGVPSCRPLAAAAAIAGMRAHRCCKAAGCVAFHTCMK